MTLFTILKQLKKIEPDPAFKETSKRAIFALAPAATRTPGVRVRHTVWKILETGAAVALTGFFVLLITGAFSGSVTPRYSAVNPDALRAEAQAIDIQIQLAHLNYAAPAAQSTFSTLQVVTSTTSGGATVTTTVSTETATGTATSTASTTMTIDQALENLAQ
jgi:hypothetical protein